MKRNDFLALAEALAAMTFANPDCVLWRHRASLGALLGMTSAHFNARLFFAAVESELKRLREAVASAEIPAEGRQAGGEG